MTIKTQPEIAFKDLYKRIGILNLFNPYHADGLYELDLAIYEERMMLTLLCEMAKRESIKNIKNIQHNKAPVEDSDGFVKGPPKEGTFTLVFNPN